MEPLYILSVYDNEGNPSRMELWHQDVLFQIGTVRTGTRNYCVGVFQWMNTRQVTQTSFLKRLIRDFDRKEVVLETQNSIYTLKEIDYSDAVEIRSEII